MAKSQTLKAALDRHKGVDHKLERQKKQQKQAEKRKRQKRESNGDAEDVEIETFSDEEEVDEQLRAQIARELANEGITVNTAEAMEVDASEGAGSETDDSDDAEEEDDEEDEEGGVDLNMMEDESESEAEDELIRNGVAEDEDDDEDDGDDEDIPLSDIESLASEDKADVIPHQRLTINNTAALLRSLKSFALPSSLPFSATQAVTSTDPVEIPDIDDDLNRELAFYKQSLDAVKEARTKLKKEGAPFARPADFFAEMVKSEEQMGKVRQKMVDEAARKKASLDARRQRDLKKFGKAVQVAKLQERDKAKRDTLDKINVLKRSTSDRHPSKFVVMLTTTNRTTRQRRSFDQRGQHV